MLNKYKIGIDYNMFIDEVCKKYDYSKDLNNVLTIIKPYLINMFHGDIFINKVLDEVEIVLTDNVYDELYKYNLLDEDNALVNKEVLRYSAGAYASKPVIKYNEETKSYYIESINRKIIVNGTNFNNEITVGILIHELLHAIKSYYNEYTISGDTLYESSGFIEKEYKLSIDNTNNVKKELTKEIGVGLEEGFNSSQEEYLTKMLYSSYTSKGYSLLKEAAKHFRGIKIPSSSERVIYSEMYHDYDAFKEYLKDDYYLLLSIIDEMYKQNVEIMDLRLTPEERMKKVNKLKIYIRKNYFPLCEKIRNDEYSENKKVM